MFFINKCVSHRYCRICDGNVIGVADLTKKGKAKIVVRNIGYHGLLPVIYGTNIARNRLVDFTG